MANIEPGELDRRHPGSRWWMRLLAAGLPAAVLMQMAANLYTGNAENLTGGREGLATLVALGVVLCAALFVGLQWGPHRGKATVGGSCRVRLVRRDPRHRLPLVAR